MSKSSVFKKILPIAGATIGTAIAPGIGTALGSSLSAGTLGTIGGAVGGATGGVASGGGLKSALIGGATGGLGAGGAKTISNAAGLSGNAAKFASGALTGAGVSALSGGGLKGALTGAALAGTGNVLLNGSTPFSNRSGSLLGSKAGSTLSQTTGNALAQGPTQGTGLLGGLTRSSGGMHLSAFGNGSGLISSYNTSQASKKIEKQLLAQQRANQNLLQPYNEQGLQANQQINDAVNSGSLGAAFSPEDLENDPGYQFRLEQGNQALDRAAAARGNLYSGAALKAAQEYGQGLADQTFNDAFNRDQQRQSGLYNILSGQQQVGLGAVGGGINVNDAIGNIQASNTAQQNNIQTNSLNSLLSGNKYPQGDFDGRAILLNQRKDQLNRLWR
jgi:hypothetical protein